MGSSTLKISKALGNVSLLGFDTAPLIYFVEKHPLYFDLMETIMSTIADGTVSGISSTLTLTELLTQPLRLGKASLVNQYEAIMVNTIGFRLVPLDLKICRTAAELRAQHNLKTPDALQVAAAIQTECHAFLTNDAGLKRVTEIRVLVLDELELDET